MRDVDALTSATLKNLREHWWDDAFTAFVKETLQPKAGKRILDVGCGTGTAEVKLSRLRIAQVDFFGVDLEADRAKVAHAAATSHNIGAHFAAGDACALPFVSGTFDSVFCVAVLQHIGDVPRAVAEFARVTRPNGRIVAVEPDNGARYWFSSLDAGLQTYEAGRQFFAGLAQARGDATDATVGPRLPALFAQHDIEPLRVARSWAHRRPRSGTDGARPCAKRSNARVTPASAASVRTTSSCSIGTRRKPTPQGRGSSRSRTRCSSRRWDRNRNRGKAIGDWPMGD
jgi:SAM-dependent methyltransferase